MKNAEPLIRSNVQIARGILRPRPEVRTGVRDRRARPGVDRTVGLGDRRHGAEGAVDLELGGTPITGSMDQIIEMLARFATLGFRRVELWWGAIPPSMAAVESLAAIVAALR